MRALLRAGAAMPSSSAGRCAPARARPVGPLSVRTATATSTGPAPARHRSAPALKAGEHLGDGLALGSRRGAHALPVAALPACRRRRRSGCCRRRGPVVVTVHDTTPFNGTPTHPLQARGFRAALAGADRLIVHTARRAAAARRARDRAGADRGRSPHGPLGGAPARARRAAERRRDPRRLRQDARPTRASTCWSRRWRGSIADTRACCG